ncbi:hypothetical protein SAMN05216548_12715 [Faunimonas pinastri]|uniref:Uncharacterized protein n=2 Tax=Faunimonas pinastri TaxID=1855383 RepID=A0A1H9QD38_9HYPH|nr:DUF6074 family protein [Faunimonas pinastri]SER58451.1 hypothetical protein SAMN05216548_12715 [Faunimonas pinastri]
MRADQSGTARVVALARCSAEVLPFPAVRRRDFVLRHASRMAQLSHDAGERHLRRQLDIQAETMARRGIIAEMIASEIRALEAAIRAELWLLVLTPGGAA